MPLIPLLLGMGVVNVGTTVYLNNATIKAGEPEPKIMGYDSRNVMMVGGLALALFGSPIMAAVGIAAATAAYNNKSTVNLIQTEIKNMIKANVEQQLAERGIVPPAQLPGPSDVPAPPPGASASDVPAPAPGAFANFMDALSPDPVPAPA